MQVYDSVVNFLSRENFTNERLLTLYLHSTIVSVDIF